MNRVSFASVKCFLSGYQKMQKMRCICCVGDNFKTKALSKCGKDRIEIFLCRHSDRDTHTIRLIRWHT